MCRHQEKYNCTIHLNTDSTLQIEGQPSQVISGTWTIEGNDIIFHYEEPRKARVDPGWNIADTKDGGFTIIQYIDPEACYWLRP